MINTIYGPMDPALLKKMEGCFDNTVEHTEWIEYWLNDELVHRSAHVTLKEGVLSESVAHIF